MKHVFFFIMFFTFLSSCNRILTQGTKRPGQAGSTKKPKQTGGTGMPNINTRPDPVGEESVLVKQAGIKRYYLKVDGITRTFLVQLPTGYSASKTYPVIFFFHSIRGKDSSWIAGRGADTYIDRNGYIAIYAQGANGGYWNVGGNYPFRKVDDVHFVQSMYDWLKSNTDIDSKKVYAAGTSNGAIMVHYLAIQTNLFAAIASVAGSLYTDEMKTSAKPVAVMQFHGTLDKTVPYNGGYNPWGYTFISAQNTASEWAKVNGCNAQPTVTGLLNGKVTAYSYNDCKSGKPVVLYSLPNVPHKVMQNFDPEWMYNQIFDFFRKNSE